MLETIAIGFSIALILGTILAFVAFIRYINHKEKQLLTNYPPQEKKENQA